MNCTPQRLSRLAGTLSAACLLFAGAPLFAEPLAVTHLIPSGAQAGQTVAVKISGTVKGWPVDVWASRDDVHFKALEKQGQLEVAVDADAEPGVCWIRLHGPGGAAPLRPFVVGRIPEISDQEPNDDADRAQPLATLPVVINGLLDKNGDVDLWSISLTKGQTLVAAVTANGTLGSPMDGVLQIAVPNPRSLRKPRDVFVLDTSDDEAGMDPLLVFTAPEDGTYLLRLFAFASVPNSSIRFSGGDTFVYRLSVTTSGYVDHAAPLALAASAGQRKIELVGWNLPSGADSMTLDAGSAGIETQLTLGGLAGNASVRWEPHPVVVADPAVDRKTGQPITAPVTLCGQIDKPGGDNVFAFDAAKGTKLTIAVESYALGFPLDPRIRILAADDSTVATADDVRTDRDPVLAFVARAEGRYRLVIDDLHGRGGLRYAYRATVVPSVPDFSLSVASDALEIPTDKPLEVTVAVIRENGFAGSISITAIDLPPGVTAEPVESEGKGATAKSVKLKLTAAQRGVRGPLKIVGTSTEPKQTRAASVPLIAFGTRTENLWLTVPPAK